MTRNLRRVFAAGLIALAAGLVPSTVSLPEVGERGPATLLSAIWNASSADAYYGTSRRVARRTSRRTSYRQNTMYEYGTYPAGLGVGATVGAAAAVGTAAYMTSLPPDCTAVHQGGAVYQRCGSSVYQPLYQGDQLVYVPVGG